MYRIEVLKLISLMTDLYHQLNFWQNDKTTSKEKFTRWLYFLIFPIGIMFSSLLGCIFSANKDDFRLLIGVTITLGVIAVKGSTALLHKKKRCFLYEKLVFIQ